MILKILLTLILGSFCSSLTKKQVFVVKDGYCRVPVADLLVAPAKDLFPNKNVASAYKDLPMGDTRCKREYQILLNEPLIIEDELEEEYRIRIPHIVYFNLNKNRYDNTYWTLKNNVVSEESLLKNGIKKEYLPSAICLKKCEIVDPYTVTLKEPFFYDGVAYSTGTRFKCENCNSDFLNCYSYDKNFKLKILPIPKSKLFFYELKSQEEKILDYITLIKNWANRDNKKFIPYLYSGSSFIYEYSNDAFASNLDGTYERKDLDVYPYVGMDCSCIISRGSQICNLPYFYKDSLTIEKNLDSIESVDDVKLGDIIWFPGHVVIISDIEKNLVLEARGYASGYGRVHECHISRMFKNVSNLKKLAEKMLNREEIILLAFDGSVRYKINNLKILKYRSGLLRKFKSLSKSAKTLKRYIEKP